MQKHDLGIIGPVDAEKLCSWIGIDKHAYFEKLKKLAAKIAEGGYEIILTPDKRSPVEFFTQTYRDNSGANVTGIFPKDDREFGCDKLNFHICDKIENCGTWAEQESYLVRRSQNLLCLGFGKGSIIEICKAGTLWKKRKDSRIFIIQDFVKGKLPSYIAEGLPVVYIKLEDFLGTL